MVTAPPGARGRRRSRRAGPAPTRTNLVPRGCGGHAVDLDPIADVRRVGDLDPEVRQRHEHALRVRLERLHAGILCRDDDVEAVGEPEGGELARRRVVRDDTEADTPIGEGIEQVGEPGAGVRRDGAERLLLHPTAHERRDRGVLGPGRGSRHPDLLERHVALEPGRAHRLLRPAVGAERPHRAQPRRRARARATGPGARSSPDAPAPAGTGCRRRRTAPHARHRGHRAGHPRRALPRPGRAATKLVRTLTSAWSTGSGTLRSTFDTPDLPQATPPRRNLPSAVCAALRFERRGSDIRERGRRTAARSSRAPSSAGPRGCCRCRAHRRTAAGRHATSAPR